MADYNRRFAVPPHHPQDAHRRVLHDDASVVILSLHSTRKLSRNLTLRSKTASTILNQGKGYRLRSSPVTVCEAFDGHVTLLGQGQTLDYRILAQGQTPVPLDDEKSLNRRHRPCPSAQTPQVQTLPRPPLEPLETPPLHSCPTTPPVTARPTHRSGWRRWFRRRGLGEFLAGGLQRRELCSSAPSQRPHMTQRLIIRRARPPGELPRIIPSVPFLPPFARVREPCGQPVVGGRAAGFSIGHPGRPPNLRPWPPIPPTP